MTIPPDRDDLDKNPETPDDDPDMEDEDERLDEQGKESFPASDPPAN
jgi:hypothetical protein